MGAFEEVDTAKESLMHGRLCAIRDKTVKRGPKFVLQKPPRAPAGRRQQKVVRKESEA